MLLNKFSPILVILLLALIIDTVVECGKDGKPGKKRSRDNQGKKHVEKEENDNMEEDGNTTDEEEEQKGNPMEAQLLALNLDAKLLEEVSDKAADAKVADLTKSCHIEKMSGKTAAAAVKLNKMNKGKGKAESSKGKGKGKDKGKGKMPAADRQSFKLLLRPATMKKKRSHVGGQQLQLTDSLLRSIKRVKGQMEEISQDQKTIRQGQQQVREKMQDVEYQCSLLKMETQLIVQQSMRTRIKLALMINILKAREDNNWDRAMVLTQFLRQIVALDEAGPSNQGNSGTDLAQQHNPQSPSENEDEEDEEEDDSASDDDNNDKK